MSQPVILTEPAFQILRRNARWWAKHRSVEQAERWYDGFLKVLDLLEDNPQRCPLARENAKFPYELRELTMASVRGRRTEPCLRFVPIRC
jgi:plasmid stabilization system protein ParE